MERSSKTQKAAVFGAMEGMLVACSGNKLVRFAHNWNDGILEKWNNGFWLPARRSYASERIMQCWINVPATDGIDDKTKMAYILLKTNIPVFHHSIIPFSVRIQKSKNLYIISGL